MKKLSQKEQATLLETLEKRFEKNTSLHKGIQWVDIAKRLNANPKAVATIAAMEETGGEPDVITLNKHIYFVDCSAESPKGRRSLCYDVAAWVSRKEHKPQRSAEDLAEEMGVEIIDETEYRELQRLGEFDLKTSSWVKTPADVRKLGGALFCDRRFGRVFTYHNGAESYYGGRGFRGKLVI
jgi:hypothetical protein